MAVCRASLLVIVVFFLYKSSESLLQPTIRLFIVESVCLLLSTPANRSLCRHVDVAGQTGISNRLRGLSLETENRNQQAAANYLLAYRILLNLPAILLSLYCGPWSDRVGRRLPMFLPSVGAVAACSILTFCLRPDWLPPLATVLVGALVYGLFGKSAVITMSCNSYLTDITTEDSRTKLLGILLGVNFIGIFIGSLLIGLYQYFDNIGPALSTASLVNCVVVFIIVFAIPEAKDVEAYQGQNDDELEEKNNNKACCTTSCKLSFPIDSLRCLFRKRPGNTRRHIIILFLSILINQLCKSGEQDAILLFVQHAPLHWSGDMYGYYLSLYYACMGFNLLVILPLVTRWFQLKDTTLIMIGITMKTVRLLMTAFADDSSAMVYSAAIIGSSAGFIVSATKSLITKLSEDNHDVGKMFSLLAAIEAASNLLGPTIFNSLYGVTVAVFPGLIFVIDACLHLSLLCIFLRLHFELDDEQEEKQKAKAIDLKFDADNEK